MPNWSSLSLSPSLLVVVPSAALLFGLATLAFDSIHWTLHHFIHARWSLLRWLGGFHQAHHDFFDRELKLQPEHRGRNLLMHVLPEYATQLAVTSSALLFLDPRAVLLALLFETILCGGTLLMGGEDANHRELRIVPAPVHGPLVTASYHAGHHAFPDAFFGSYTTFFDVLMGTGAQLKGRTVAMTGASGAFGAPLKELLEREGATVTALKYGVDYTYDDYSRLDGALKSADILVLAHGSKKDRAMEANCDSFVEIIRRFRSLAAERQFAPEIWAVGSEIEAHPAFGNADLRIYLESKRAYARHAHRLYFDRSVVYRHIVPSSFRSRMGPGLFSGETAARIALFFIRRGFRYVPVTYTGIALLNYFKFLAAPFLGPGGVSAEERAAQR